MKKTLGMVVLMIAAMGVVGCSDSHEKVVEDQLELLEKLLGVLEGVTDEESAEASLSELESIRAEDELIDARLQELGQLKRAEKRELAEEYGQATEDAVGDLWDQHQRLEKMPAGMYMLLLWETMKPVLAELSLTDAAERIAESNDVACLLNQKGIVGGATLYRAVHGSAPTALADLVPDGFIVDTPVCPEGGTYTVDGTCTVNHTD
jgi:hypothetical protein